MRSLCLSVIVGLAMQFGSVMYAQQIPPLPADPAVRVGKLDNGLTYFIRHNEHPEGRAHFYIAQRVGSLQEEESQRGLAHFLEHMAFNGTKHFPGKSMINWLETIGVRFGSNLNAYTGLNRTVYTIMDAPVARQTVIDSCVLILRDWSNGISLEEKEIDAERGVIQEEWRQRDNAMLRLYTKVFERAFPGSRYGNRMPIGLMDVVRGFGYDELRAYYRKWYRPDLQALIIVGDVDVDYVEASIKQAFADIPAPVNPAEREYIPVEDHQGVLPIVETDPEATSTIVSILFKADQSPRELRASQLGVMEDFIKSAIKSMAAQRFTDITTKSNAPFITANLDLSKFLTAETKDCFDFTATASEGKYLEALNALTSEMERIRQYGFTKGEYQRAVADIIAGIKREYNERDKRRNGVFAEEYAEYFTEGGNIADIETIYNIYQLLAEQLPVEVINEVCKSTLGEDNIVVILSGPKKEGLTYPTEEKLAQQFASARAVAVEPYADEVSNTKLIDKAPKAGKIIKEDKNGQFGSTIWTLSNGVKVVYKTTDFKDDEIRVSAVRPGGLLSFAERAPLEARTFNAVAGVGGVGSFSVSNLQKALAGRNVSVRTYLEDTADAVSGNSTVEDLETLLQLIYLSFTAPRQDDEAFVAYKDKARSMIAMRRNHPLASVSDSISEALYPGWELRRQLDEAEVDQIDYTRVLSLYKERFGDANGFQFFFVGNVDPAQLRPLVETYLASLPSKKKSKHVAPYDQLRHIRSGAYTNHYSIEMETPMGFVFNTLTARIPADQKSRLTLTILGEILNQIYVDTLREEEGGTYGAHVEGGLTYQPKDEAQLVVLFQTDPEKADQLNSFVYRDMQKILTDGTPKDKFDKVIANLEKSYNERLKENGSWTTNLRTYYYNGRDEHTHYLETLRSITPEEVQASLKTLMESGNRIELMLRPAPAKGSTQP